jgi:DNA-binding GntR family transcriptional regulator
LKTRGEVMPSEKRPLREIIYNDFRKQILSGRLMPGARLIESSLAENFKTSRTIIREVIKQLELEGWVKIIPYKGAEVSRLSLDTVRELYCIQAALEGLAAGLGDPENQQERNQGIAPGSKTAL